MTHSFYSEMFNYQYLANQRYIERLSDCSPLPTRPLRLLSHILNAQLIWLARIQGSKVMPGAWDEYPLEHLAELNDLAHQKGQELLKEIDLSQLINYTNSKGQVFENSIADILYHIVNHGTYHRGQMAYLLRDWGEAVPPTDFVVFKRGE